MFKLLLLIPEVIAALVAMNAIHLEFEQGNLKKYYISDSCIVEVLDYTDSALVVQTVCAPICSSTARVFSKDNKLIRTIRPADMGIFPYAWIENDTLHWRDNTDQLLDDEEKKRR